jgi:hypothetical protein
MKNRNEDRFSNFNLQAFSTNNLILNSQIITAILIIGYLNDMYNLSIYILF